MTSATRELDISGTAPVPFSRLVRVEWRKMLDTRAGRWLLIITGGLIALVVAFALLILALTDDGALSAADWLDILTIPLAMLVPVIAITIVTQEWGQRTAMVTFSLEPSRLRVIAAKLVAVIALAAVTVVFALLLGLVGNLVGAGLEGTDAEWNVTAGQFGWHLLVQALYLLMGFGFGLLLLSSPAAVAIYYVYVWILEGGVIVPGILYVLWFAFDWAQTVVPWISMRIAILPFQLEGADRASVSDEGIPLATGALGVAHIVVAITLWVVLPIVLGTWRTLRAEVK